MELLSKFISLALLAIFAENTVFSRGVGASSALCASKNPKQLFGFGACITVITTLSNGAAYYADLFLRNNSYSYIYMPLIYIMIIGVIYILILLFLWKWAHTRFLSVKRFVHMSAFNCAVLGALLISSRVGSDLVSYLGFGLGTGAGFIIAEYLLAEGYRRLYSDKLPKYFKGYPAMLLYIGILSMCFYGFMGHSPAM